MCIIHNNIQHTEPMDIAIGIGGKDIFGYISRYVFCPLSYYHRSDRIHAKISHPLTIE